MSALKGWLKSAKAVQQQADLAAAQRGSTTISAAYHDAARTVKISAEDGVCEPDIEELSSTDWRKLLSKKVPLQLAAASTKVLRHLLPAWRTNDSSILTFERPTSHSSTQPTTAARWAEDCCYSTLSVLCELVGSAHTDLGMAAGPSERVTAFRQQLQQSGFLQLLPELFSSLAERMQQSAALKAQLEPLPESAQVAQPTDSMPRQHYLNLDVVSDVLWLYSSLSDAWPPGVFVREVVPDCTAPVLQLSWLCFQYLSTKAAAFNAQPGDNCVAVWHTLHRPLQCAEAGAAAAKTVLLGPPASTSRVLASPGGVPCLLNLITVQVCTILLAQLPELPPPASARSSMGGSSNTGGSTSTGSSSDTAVGGSSTSSSGLYCWNDNIAAAWKLAQREVAKLPTSHSILLRQLGSSPLSAMLYAAKSVYMATYTPELSRTACTQPESSSSTSPLTPHMDAAGGAKLYEDLHLLLACLPALVDAGSSSLSAGDVQSEALSAAQHQLLHLLLSPVLLYLAAQQPAEHSGSTQAADIHLLVQAATAPLTSVTSGTEPLPQWLWQLVRQEVTSLATAVGAAVLMSNGCNFASSSGVGSSSSSTGSNSKQAAAISSSPAATALQLAECLCALGAPDGCGVLIGQLLEISVRAAPPGVCWWVCGIQRLLNHLHTVITDAESSEGGTEGGKQSTSSGGGGGGGGGASPAAAQVQGLQHNEPASHQQQQLASVCFSVLKRLSTELQAQPGFISTPEALSCCYAVAETASRMLCLSVADCGMSAVASAPGGGSHTQLSAADAAAVPWLVLSGRFLQFVSQQLPATATGLGPDTSTADAAESRLLLQTVGTVFVGLRRWLQTAGGARALAAAGYDPSGSLLQQLHVVCGDAEGPDSSSATDGLSQLQPETLRSLGQRLNTLPFACACNNPTCSNLVGPLELQLVNNKTCVCSGCRVARFCSRACLAQHWKQHRPVCRAIAAAQAASAAEDADAAQVAAAALPMPTSACQC